MLCTDFATEEERIEACSRWAVSSRSLCGCCRLVHLRSRLMAPSAVVAVQARRQVCSPDQPGRVCCRKVPLLSNLPHPVLPAEGPDCHPVWPRQARHLLCVCVIKEVRLRPACACTPVSMPCDAVGGITHSPRPTC